MRKSDFRERKQLEELVQDLNRDVDSIVVEGLSDRRVMEELGFQGKIFLSAEREISDLTEDISRGAEKVAVLTDFDNHGKKMNREISQELEEEVDIIRTSRKDFGAQLTSTGRQCIEDIAPLFHSKEDKFVEARLDGLFFKG